MRHALFAIRSFPRILFEHDLFGKPASTFPDHALARPRIARENERPEHFVFGVRGKSGGDAEPRHAAIEQIGAMRRRVAPAGKRFGERVVAGGNILHHDDVGKGRIADALLERLADIVIHRVVLGHRNGLLVRHAHQIGIDADRAEPIVAAIAGDHRGRSGGIDRHVRLRQILIEARLARRRLAARAAGHNRDADRGASERNGRMVVIPGTASLARRFPLAAAFSMIRATPVDSFPVSARQAWRAEHLPSPTAAIPSS
jgi:hypothetical protein